MSELPPGWQWSSLGDLVESREAITDGPFGSNLKSSHYTGSGPRVIRLQNIGDGEFLDTEAHISEAHYESLKKHVAEAGDLVVASLGTELPRSCIVPEWLGPAIVKADCIRVRLPATVSVKYVNYCLNSPTTRKQASELVHGVGRPRLGLKTIRALRIPLPPLAEQHQVVAAIEEQFSRLDDAEQLLVTADLRLRRLKRSIFDSIVPSEVPADWQWVTVGDAGTVDLGRQRSPKDHHGPNMRPYLRVANVFEDRIVPMDVMEMNFTPEQYERSRLVPGDILLNEGQSPELVGRPAMYRGDPPDVAFTNSLIRFRPGPGVDGEFALLIFRRHLHSGRFRREARITTNIAHMAAGRFKEVEFPLPPIADQQRIVARVQGQLTRLDALQRSLHTAAARSAGLRRSILRSAFRGQLGAAAT